jgi:hypothetical protein
MPLGSNESVWVPAIERSALSRRPTQNTSITVPDECVRTVAAADRFRVPFALVILIFNSFSVAGDFLLAGRRLRSGQCLRVSRESFRKHAIYFVGPATIVLDNFVSDIRHKTPFCSSAARIKSRQNPILSFRGTLSIRIDLGQFFCSFLFRLSEFASLNSDRKSLKKARFVIRALNLFSNRGFLHRACGCPHA